MDRPKMAPAERAKQFMPFAALKDLPAALRERERIVVPRPELSEEMAEELDRLMHRLKKGGMATVVYFSRGECLKVTGIVARIDETARVLQIVNTKIAFSDILQVEIPD